MLEYTSMFHFWLDISLEQLFKNGGQNLGMIFCCVDTEYKSATELNDGFVDLMLSFV